MTNSNNNGSLLVKPLGLYGWDEIEPVLLAAIASETPLLLLGTHGCAKSFFLENLAQALNLEYRFYNASLINYDDLVGIPIPSEDKKRLEYIASPESIWDAEVVFMDEINRTKPELQSKLFPIIHERRVQGVSLDKLRYRWAAMNPAAPEDIFTENAYVGTEPLDTALADRFGFIVEVPPWEQLSREEKKAILDKKTTDAFAFPIPISDLVAACRVRMNMLLAADNHFIKEYLIILVDELNRIKIHLSTRRITMLYNNIIAVFAAMETLGRLPDDAEVDTGWSEAAITAIQHSMPQRAEGTAPDSFKLRVAHLQAWSLILQEGGNVYEQELLTIACPEERLLKALDNIALITPETLATVVISFLYAAPNEEERAARALALYAATQQHLSLPVEALDAMTKTLGDILNPIEVTQEVEEYTSSYVDVYSADLRNNRDEMELTEDEIFLLHNISHLERWALRKNITWMKLRETGERFTILYKNIRSSCEKNQRKAINATEEIFL